MRIIFMSRSNQNNTEKKNKKSMSLINKREFLFSIKEERYLQGKEKKIPPASTNI
jgi:hypothetical protein